MAKQTDDTLEAYRLQCFNDLSRGIITLIDALLPEDGFETTDEIYNRTAAISAAIMAGIRGSEELGGEEEKEEWTPPVISPRDDTVDVNLKSQVKQEVHNMQSMWDPRARIAYRVKQLLSKRSGFKRLDPLARYKKVILLAKEEEAEEELKPEAVTSLDILIYKRAIELINTKDSRLTDAEGDPLTDEALYAKALQVAEEEIEAQLKERANQLIEEGDPRLKPGNKELSKEYLRSAVGFYGIVRKVAIADLLTKTHRLPNRMEPTPAFMAYSLEQKWRTRIEEMIRKKDPRLQDVHGQLITPRSTLLSKAQRLAMADLVTHGYVDRTHADKFFGTEGISWEKIR